MNAFLRASFPGQENTGSKSLKDLDKFIADVFPKKYQRKMARVIGEVCDTSGEYFSADEVANRLKELVNEGVYAGYGNLDKWGFSEIGPVLSDK